MRDKGRHYEHELVALLNDLGLPAWRVPLSGALGGRFSSDVRISIGKSELRIESKMRASPKGFKGFIENLPVSFIHNNQVFHAMPLEHLTLDTLGTMNVVAPKVILRWLGNNDALAIRLHKRLIGGSGWLIAINASSLEKLRKKMQNS